MSDKVLISVKLHGFDEGIAEIRGAAKRYQSVVEKNLEKFGDSEVKWLQAKIRQRELGLKEKKRPDGKPPLIDSEKYILSLTPVIEKFDSLQIQAVGMNDFLPNEDLSDILEYGNKTTAARPHIRPMLVHMRDVGVPLLGAAIFNDLWGG